MCYKLLALISEDPTVQSLCLSVCLPTDQSVDISTHLPSYLPTYPPTHPPTHPPTYLPTYLATHLPNYLPTHPPTHLHTYVLRFTSKYSYPSIKLSSIYTFKTRGKLLYILIFTFPEKIRPVLWKRQQLATVVFVSYCRQQATWRQTAH